MLVIWRLKEEGVLDDLTLQAVGNIFDVNRSTIHRDLKELEVVEREYDRLMAEQPWIRRELTTAEFAEEIGASADTVRMMLRDGLIEARKRVGGRGSGEHGQWYIPIGELDKFSFAR